MTTTRERRIALLENRLDRLTRRLENRRRICKAIDAAELERYCVAIREHLDEGFVLGDPSLAESIDEIVDDLLEQMELPPGIERVIGQYGARAVMFAMTSVCLQPLEGVLARRITGIRRRLIRLKGDADATLPE